jgi:putative ABC transport system substrate-binding protein
LPAYRARLRVIEALAPSLGMHVVPASARDAVGIERAIETSAPGPNDGLIVQPGVFTTAHRDLIVALAGRHRLPAAYPFRYFATGGGLISYGIDVVDLYRRGASYVDRILRGVNPANLPVQAPTKFELVINLKTAKALGLEISPALLARADAVIE